MAKLQGEESNAHRINKRQIGRNLGIAGAH